MLRRLRSLDNRMTERILIVGAGFAGMWSALGAARLLDVAGRSDGSIEVAVIAPEPALHLRPRFYETAPRGMKVPLSELFKAIDIRFIEGRVDHIHTLDRTVAASARDGGRFTVRYDRLVVAAGSELHRPNVRGLAEHAHSVDTIDEASRLDAHLSVLASAARNTIVVVGGGFTGIEIASELPSRLRALLGAAVASNVIVIEQANDIGPDLGPGPRPVISAALESLGITVRLRTAVAAIDADGIWTSTDERIEAKTVIWTAGLRANALTREVDAPRDDLGRLHVARDLRVLGIDGMFATGDAAFALLDDDGHHALMSCQHAMTMGKFAGYNVAADLIGIATIPYNQPRYVTCLDLGEWGAVYSEGWDREVTFVREKAKALKRMINTQWIYPPRADRASALAAADPNRAVAG